MEVREAIKKRRSIRRYKDTPIPEQDLMEILEAGLYAPSAVNLQPWYVVAIRSAEGRKKLEETMAHVSRVMEPSLRERFAKHPEVAAESTRFIRQLGGAPLYILVFQMKDEYKKTASTITQSVAAAIENMLLAATEKGLGSCWLTAPVEAGAGDQLRETFAPEKGELVALLTLGYPEVIPEMPKRKQGRYVIL